MIGCYYRRLPAEGDLQTFSPTDYTRSNWDPELQHGSPPLALLTKLIEEKAAGFRWPHYVRERGWSVQVRGSA